MSRIRANTITNKAATGAPNFSNGAVVTGVCTATSFAKADGSAVGGKVLQVVQATKTDGASSSVASGGAWLPTTPKCSITPSNASNKILVQATVVAALSTNAHGMYLQVLKDGSPIFRGDQDGSNMQRVTTGTYSHNDYNFGHLNFNYLDTAGGTSAIEYSLELRHDSGSSSTIYLNRTEATDNSDDRKRGATSIILMEIAA